MEQAIAHSKKLIIFTAPSGAGKTTLVRHLLSRMPGQLAFSVSATTRERRAKETEGKDYYFLGETEFKRRVDAGLFLEYEEVYKGTIYGTLRSEVDRIWQEGKIVMFDVDVKGATNIKAQYPENSLAIFVKPPSIEALEQRLKLRKSESEESLRKRIARAKMEMEYEDNFDVTLVNDVLSVAKDAALAIVESFLLPKSSSTKMDDNKSF